MLTAIVFAFIGVLLLFFAWPFLRTFLAKRRLEKIRKFL
jgi:hypothetical protein